MVRARIRLISRVPQPERAELDDETPSHSSSSPTQHLSFISTETLRSFHSCAMSNADSSLHRTPSDPDSPSYLIASLNRHLKDLSTFQIPRLAECSGPKTLQEELVAELREDMEELKKGMEVRLQEILISRRRGCRC